MQNLKNLKGIGEKSEKALNARGIFSCADLAKVTPVRFYALGVVQKFEPEQKALLVEGKVIEEPKVTFLRGLSFVQAKVEDTKSPQKFLVKWFNQPYMKKNLKLGEMYRFFGNTKKTEMIVILHKPKEKFAELEKFFPVYQKLGVKRNILQNAISEAQKMEIKGVIPEKLAKKYELMPADQAYRVIHNPKSEKELCQAQKRVNIEKTVEYLLNEKEVCVITEKQREKWGIEQKEIERLEKLIPFSLTKGQKKAIEEITADLNRKISMNRLLQGDVGSGKTVVAFITAIAVINSKKGTQTAFMAPTEILAKQHYETFQKLFGKEVSSALLTSSIDKKQAEEIKKKVENGEIEFVIGTHLLSSSIEFKNLGVVIIDEQHRFGVEQRAKFMKKSKTQDTLLLSATPIPRSMKLTSLGKLKISLIEERPSQNNVQTYVVPQKKESDMWTFIEQTEGKVFVVCPRIEEVDDPFEENQVASTTAMKKFLEQRFKSEKILEIDGKKSEEEIYKSLELFQNSKNKFIVATTMIEVGIDIKEATVVVIKNPERFGLATLHQIRGRVGRDGKKAYCFVLASVLTQKSKERLKFFCENNNGFEIAEYDYKTRGGGEIHGTAQHGEGGKNNDFEEFNLARILLQEMKKPKRKEVQLISSN